LLPSIRKLLILVFLDTSAQEILQILLKAHPEMAAAIQTVIRNAATTDVGSNVQVSNQH
jgi:hypothetical protein